MRHRGLSKYWKDTEKKSPNVKKCCCARALKGAFESEVNGRQSPSEQTRQSHDTPFLHFTC